MFTLQDLHGHRNKVSISVLKFLFSKRSVRRPRTRTIRSAPCTPTRSRGALSKRLATRLTSEAGRPEHDVLSAKEVVETPVRAQKPGMSRASPDESNYRGVCQIHRDEKGKPRIMFVSCPPLCIRAEGSTLETIDYLALSVHPAGSLPKRETPQTRPLRPLCS